MVVLDDLKTKVIAPVPTSHTAKWGEKTFTFSWIFVYLGWFCCLPLFACILSSFCLLCMLVCFVFFLFKFRLPAPVHLWLNFKEPIRTEPRKQQANEADLYPLKKYLPVRQEEKRQHDGVLGYDSAVEQRYALPADQVQDQVWMWSLKAEAERVSRWQRTPA